MSTLTIAFPTETNSSNSPETIASSQRAAGISDSSQSNTITTSSTSADSAASATTLIIVSSNRVFYGMAALSEEDVRFYTVQRVFFDVHEISFENAEQSDGDLAILEAENDAARLAADAAAARLCLLHTSAFSSRTSTSRYEIDLSLDETKFRRLESSLALTESVPALTESIPALTKSVPHLTESAPALTESVPTCKLSSRCYA